MSSNLHFTTGAVSLAISLAVNGAVFFSFEKAFDPQNPQVKRALTARVKAEEKSLSLEFVEAPRQAFLDVPEKTKRVAERSALNQDLQDKRAASGNTKTAVRGPSDQLAQKKGRGRPSTPAMLLAPIQQQPVQPEKSGSEAPPGPEVASIQTRPVMNPQPVVQPALPAFKASEEGQDRITTQEMSRRKATGAKLYGATSFEATGSGMGVYMKNLKEKIWLAWFPYLAFNYPQDFSGADAVLSITLNSRGEVKILRLLEGDPIFGTYCMNAIQRAGDFGPLPREILDLVGGGDLEIRFAFHYR